jgi:glycolate oxidase iron-sulfur subunit
MDLITDCVHCGFCLPTCPSYAVFEEEMDSPRGRIVLMRIGHEEGSEVSREMTTHLDRCLGCMACVTACPSGVQYDRLIERARPQIERNGPRTRRERWLRDGIFALFTHPGRLRAAVPLMALQQRLKLPVPFGNLAPKVPVRAAMRRLPEVTPAVGSKRGRIALMQGCIQRVFFGDVNAATVRVLAAEGWEVHAPRRPRCCGALQLHTGVEGDARELARATIDAYEGFDHVVVNVAGCGSAMKEYGYLFEGDERAEAFSAKVLDVHELLAAHEPRAERKPLPLKVAITTPAISPMRSRSASSRAFCFVEYLSWISSTLRNGSYAAARPGSTTSSSRRPPRSSANARPRTSRPRAPRRSPPPTPAARSRSPRTWRRKSRSTTP